MKNNESEEMYLETIFLVQKTKGKARAADVARELNYARSSVSDAVHKLNDNGLITIDREGTINFTAKGKTAANNVCERHRVLTEFFVSIGAECGAAEDNARRIKHVISADLFELIKRYTER